MNDGCRAAVGSLSAAMSVVSNIVKAYDVRGTVPDQLNVEVAHALGVGFARFVTSTGATRVVVARDMRPSGRRRHGAGRSATCRRGGPRRRPRPSGAEVRHALRTGPARQLRRSRGEL